jgi:phosphoglycerate dehydrogenase-like enzyme
MVGEQAIRALPKEAILVNVGRGAIVDEAALFSALKEGRIRGAGIDVWWTYPKEGEVCKPSRFSFEELPNVVMSPHVGGSVTDSEPKRLTALASLLSELATGADPPRLDPTRGY